MTRRTLTAVLLLGASCWACSAEQTVRPELAPPALVVGTPPRVTPPPAHAAKGQPPPLDLSSFAPLLASPELARAAEELEAGDPAAAAREVRAVAESGRPLPAASHSLDLLQARLLHESGDLPEALVAFARAAAVPWTLQAYAALGAARAAVRLGRAEDARSHLDRVQLDPPISGAARATRAELCLLVGDREGAIALFREVLEAKGGAASDGALALRLAEELTLRADGLGRDTALRHAAADEALSLSRRVLGLAGSPEERLARAAALEKRALELLPEAVREQRRFGSPREEADRLAALADAKAFEAARTGAETLLRRLGPAAAATTEACDARVVLGRAHAGLRAWGKGAEVMGEVVRHCSDAELRARALFLSGKYADSDGRPARAIRHYEQLEREQPRHRLADDARLRAAQSHLELGAEGRFTELLVRMPDDYPGGDMVQDGLFALSQHRMSKSDWSGAASVLERASQEGRAIDVSRGQELSGREAYFLARAWAMLGEGERALSAYEGVVRGVPLSYYMLHAYSRLAAADETRARSALGDSMEQAKTAPFAFEHHPEFEKVGFRRALELLRVGDVDAARAEFEESGVLASGTAPAILWGVALLYERAGSARLSHALLRGMPGQWLHRWPGGEWARAWQIAFPRPYAGLVAREAKQNALPEALVYAIMREESAFDPGAESPAKAYGLMQIIEPTARHFGKKIGLVGDPASLLRPRVNVAIGCRVLAEFTRGFADNPLLAIPGYNAGPGRPRRWAGERADQDFDLWVEQIPFVETRRYTKRVLASRATYAFLYAPEAAEGTLRLPLRVLSR